MQSYEVATVGWCSLCVEGSGTRAVCSAENSYFGGLVDSRGVWDSAMVVLLTYLCSRIQLCIGRLLCKLQWLFDLLTSKLNWDVMELTSGSVSDIVLKYVTLFVGNTNPKAYSWNWHGACEKGIVSYLCTAASNYSNSPIRDVLIETYCQMTHVRKHLDNAYLCSRICTRQSHFVVLKHQLQLLSSPPLLLIFYWITHMNS